MRPYDEIIETPGGILLAGFAVVLFFGQLAAVILLLSEGREKKFFLPAVLQMAAVSLWFALMMDGKPPVPWYKGESTPPDFMTAFHALPWGVMLCCELVMATLTALSLRMAFSLLPKDEATERYRTLQEVLKEEALLQTRIRVHDELGELLLRCRQYLDHPDGADGQELLDRMRKTNQDLLGQLEENSAEDELDNALIQAKGIGVAVRIEGRVPEDPRIRRILGHAVRECAANTVRHAGGDRLEVFLLQKDARLRAELRNNGRAPEKPPREQGGLKSLRQMTEACGGSMKIEMAPVFRVILDLPEQSQ